MSLPDSDRREEALSPNVNRSRWRSGHSHHARAYVVVTGSIAAGASTLAQILIDQLGWVGHLEGHVDQDNRFFADAYSDFPRWGFQSQVHFLVNSVHRHDELRTMLSDPSGTTAPPIVEDRTPFEHTGAYLRSYERLRRISDRESHLLRNLTSVLERSYLTPDLLVYRQMTTEQLMARVAERGRPGEDAADLELLQTVRESFDDFVAAWDRSAKIVVPADIDVLEPAAVAPLVEQIAEELRGICG